MKPKKVKRQTLTTLHGSAGTIGEPTITLQNYHIPASDVIRHIAKIEEQTSNISTYVSKQPNVEEDYKLKYCLSNFDKGLYQAGRVPSPVVSCGRLCRLSILRTPGMWHFVSASKIVVANCRIMDSPLCLAWSDS